MAATAKLTPFPVPAQPNPITQIELAVLLSLRGRLHQFEEQVEAAEQSIRVRLEAGTSIERGDHTARLEERFRANVAWKEKAINLAERLGLNGQAWAQNVLTTPAKPGPSRCLSLKSETPDRVVVPRARF